MRLVPASDLTWNDFSSEVSTTVTDAAGRFTLLGVTLGQYLLRAHRIQRGAMQMIEQSMTVVGGTVVGGSFIGGGGGAQYGATMYAEQSVSVGETNVTDVALTFRPGAEVSGQVVFDGAVTPPTPQRLSQLTVSLSQVDQRSVDTPPLLRVGEDGRFRTNGFPPGRYRLNIASPGAPWTVTAITAGGVDLLRRGLELGTSHVSDVVVTFSDRVGELSGTLQGDATRINGAQVTAIPVDYQNWIAGGFNPVFQATTFASKTGTYQLRLPIAGDYFVIALETPVTIESDAALLASIARAGTRVTMAAGDKTNAGAVAWGAAMTRTRTVPSLSLVVSFSLIASLSVAATLSLFAQTRDSGRPPFTGTSLISGVVTSDEADRRPVRRAVVRVYGAEGIGGRTAITDDRGRFTLPDLPAGRYSLYVSKPGWIDQSYGGKTGVRYNSGVSIALVAGQRMTDISIRLVRGAVVAGRVVDQDGRPMAGLRPVVMEFRTIGGQPRLQQVYGAIGGPLGQTDDRGEFRLFGLPPGSFIVGVTFPPANSGFRQNSAAELQWARQPVSPGASSTPPATAGAQGYAPMFFPGVDDPTAATTIALAAGEERTGIDITVRPVFTSRVAGMIVRSDGQPVRGAQVTIAPARDAASLVSSIDSSATIRPAVDPSGKFSAPAVRPGRYAISVRAPSVMPTAAGRGTGGAPPPRIVNDLWATTEFVADGRPIDDLSLTLQPGVTLSGRIVLANGSTAAPPDFSRTRLQMIPALASGRLSVGTSNLYLGTANADGTFTIQGVAPDRYVLTAISSIGWMTKSITAGTRDITDGNFEIQTSAVDDITLTLTDRIGEISGLLLDPTGRPAPEYYVFVFPADRSMWTPLSRRFRPPVRPGSDGKFTIASLPPGDYMIVALNDIQDEVFLDASFLEQLLPGAIKITLAEGEKKVQDIRIK